MRSEEMIKLLPAGLREVLQKMNLDVAGLQEIRLRAEQPAVILSHGKEYVSQTVIHRRQLEETLAYLGNYSLYAYEEEIRRGYLSLPGGHRVGIAGRVVVEDGNIRTITAISSLNLRFAHQILGCADEVIPFLWQDGALQSTLIVSPPGKGKTTMLRDCIRQISNGTLIHPGMTVGLVDERSEIAGCSGGIPGNDVGIRTDVLDACPKAKGLMMLIRSMAPEVVAADEIGSQEDLESFYLCHALWLRTVCVRSWFLIPGTSGKAGSEGSGQRKVVFPLHFSEEWRTSRTGGSYRQRGGKKTLLKIMGWSLILVGGLGFGDAAARELGKRVAQLEELQRLLLILQGEIRCVRITLPAVCELLAKEQKLHFNSSFGRYLKILESGQDRRQERIWSRNLKEIQKLLFLTKKEQQDLEEFGQLLGRMDMPMQLSAIQFYQEKIMLSLAEAKAAADSRQKLYRYLGALGGAALVLVIM